MGDLNENKIRKVEKIEWLNHPSVFLNLTKDELSHSLENKHHSKKDKLYLLKKWDYKTIKYAIDSVESSNYNREIINKEHDKIGLFYEKYGIDKKYLDNAKDFIDRVLIGDYVDNRSFSKVMQLINWCRFLVLSNVKEWKNSYIQMEMKKLSSIDKDILRSEHGFDEKRIKKNKIVIHRHVDEWGNFEMMKESLLEGKNNILSKIDDYKDVDLVKSSAWFWDEDFINWWKNQKKGKSSNIINLFEEELKYSNFLWKNERENGFWRKRINKQSSLASSIEKYEKDVKPLAEWERIIDLVEMEKIMTWKSSD